ncbi:hypothetical protein [Nannocystis radixulma]|uniref:Uncharacterized protein n=1 Tax=Nannocystis radixulma TaxID=2995305 RepID=A0ABT5AXS4_9BACT|nr:hypothetical protein [Nannocystis radixulma]MDC0666642.1 hypothetical protein [Nannocystis radixulma]
MSVPRALCCFALSACTVGLVPRDTPAPPPEPDPVAATPPPAESAPAPAPSAPEAAPAPASEPSPPAASPPPTDPVLVRVAAWRPDLESACAEHTELACTREGDLDGDGKQDGVALVRPRGDTRVGLAIVWGRGGGDLLGAGEQGRTWRQTIDGNTSTAPIPDNFDFLARWDVLRADGPAGKRRGFIDGKGRKFKVRGVVGDGLLLDGGDSATVAFWDGKQWRLEYLGF